MCFQRNETSPHNREMGSVMCKVSVTRLWLFADIQKCLQTSIFTLMAHACARHCVPELVVSHRSGKLGELSGLLSLLYIFRGSRQRT